MEDKEKKFIAIPALGQNVIYPEVDPFGSYTGLVLSPDLDLQPVQDADDL